MELIWHYTSLVHLEMIEKDQCLKVSNAEREFGFNPALWFSKNDFWEPTATKMKSNGNCLTINQQLETIGMIRIGVEFTDNMISWKKYKHFSKMPVQMYDSMAEIGIEKGGNPDDWFCLFSDLPSKYWKTIEEYDGKKWVDILDC